MRAAIGSFVVRIKTPVWTMLLLTSMTPLLACSGSPTSPTDIAMRLRQPSVMVGGTVMNGMTVSRDHGDGQPTRFEARLETADGRPASGNSVIVRYTRPGGMMMTNQGQFTLYDDGTHGDHIAGDGIYCFEDWDIQYGCAGYGMVAGDYHYEFYGQHGDGTQSNHMNVTVTLS